MGGGGGGGGAEGVVDARERERERESLGSKKKEKKMETELREEGRRDKICKRGVKKKQRGRGGIQTSTTSG